MGCRTWDPFAPPSHRVLFPGGLLPCSCPLPRPPASPRALQPEGFSWWDPFGLGALLRRGTARGRGSSPARRANDIAEKGALHLPT